VIFFPVHVRTLITWVSFVPSTQDPDERRRRALLVWVSAVILFTCLLIQVDSIRQYPLSQLLSGYFLRDLWQLVEARQLFYGSLGEGASLLLIGWLNRQNLGRRGWLPGALLLATLTVLISQGDTPAEIVNGRSLMLWVLPIALAPLILPAWTAFLAATASAAAITGLAWVYLGRLNWYGLLALYVIAFVSWLSARALEQALRAERNEAEQSRVILDQIADGVVVVDETGQVQVANPAARRLLGADLESAVRQTETRLETPERVVEFSWAQIQGVGRAAVLRDITRQVEIDRAKDALLGTVSHELRTPLAAISGFAEVIGLLSTQPQITDLAGRIVVNVGRLKGLVNSLLDQAQLQSGTLKLNYSDVSPARLAVEVHRLLLGLAAEKHLALEIQVSPETPDPVQGDPERLHQVLVNLVGNAIKFTDQGTVTLEIFSLPENCWGCTVTDSGDGIPAARLPDIFKPFRRGADYATRTRQGAGLGLSITQHLVERMGGTLTVTSEVGSGSVFTVALPVGGPR
jgi:signal transduction histidine kinase